MASFFDQFSIGFKLRNDKQKKPKECKMERQHKLYRTKTFTKKGNLSAELARNLISLGYSLDSIMCLMKLHNFSNVEEALNLLEKDPITKLYNHYFFERKKNNYFSQDSKSENLIIQVKKEIKIENNKKTIGIEDRCRICGGSKEEHISEKDEFTKELDQAKKKYEKDQYYECESTNLNRKERNNMDMKIKVIERVKTLENNININKDKNKYMILNLNNNIHKYYMNKRQNNDNSQTSMLLYNSRTQTGNNTNNFSFLNQQNRNNNKLNQIKNGSINNEQKENKDNKNGKNSKKSELITESKIELKTEENNIDDKNINDNNELIINSKEIDDDINKDEENSVISKLGKFGINLETINQFKNSELCKICCSNMINKNNNAQKDCQHYFCDECIKRYMTYQINNGIVLEIKCLMAGCPHIYTSEEIKENVPNDVYRKYVRFYGIQIKMKNPEKVYINCPFVDCDELVDVTDVPKGNVICGLGHVFCNECRKLGGHSRANSECDKKELNLDLYNELKKKNPTKIYQNYKQCPECKVLIEKNDGCNEMKCLNCGFVFCWLCLREYTDNHYSIYNVKGCPGMRFETVSTYKIRNNFCLNVLWHMLSCFLYILFFISIYLFYLFAGCPYEFVRCYLERKTNNDENKSNTDSIEIYDENVNEFGIGFRNKRNVTVYPQMFANNNEIKEETGNKNSKLIIGLLIFLGILCQPLYLSFYAIYTLIECYKRINCLFFLPR